MFEPTDLTFSYTRAQAIQDGVLVDVTEQAKEAGFRIPVAVTAAVWAECVDWPDSEWAAQDQSGRHGTWCGGGGGKAGSRRGEGGGRASSCWWCLGVWLAKLVLHIGPGDGRRPVATIMLPGED